ncbi:hypothetical protein ACE6H2_016136 [Prunus campanulata]
MRPPWEYGLIGNPNEDYRSCLIDIVSLIMTMNSFSALELFNFILCTLFSLIFKYCIVVILILISGHI